MEEYYGNNDWRDYCNSSQSPYVDQNEFQHSIFEEDLYPENDWRDYLEHAWGTSPKMKAAEKKYNAEYWEKHKERIMARRRKLRMARFKINAASELAKRRGGEGGEEKSSGNESLDSLRERKKNRLSKAERMAEYKKNFVASNGGDDEEGESKSKSKKGSGSSKKSDAEKAAEKAKKEAEKAAKKKQREEEKAVKDAERAANKKKREEEKAVRDAERAANKQKREQEKAAREAERVEKKRISDAERAEREAEKARTKAEKERAKEIEKRDAEIVDKLVEKYYGSYDEGNGKKTPVNNFHAFKETMAKSGHSASSDSELKKIWKQVKSRVADEDEVNQKGFVDKEVQSSLLNRFKREADNSEDGRSKTLDDYDEFRKVLDKSGHSDLSDPQAEKLWRDMRKKLRS